jgi:hypothetical protein
MTTSCFKAADLSEKQTFQTWKMRRRIFIFGGGCSLGLRPFKYGWDVVCTYLYSILFIKFVVLFWWRWVVFWDTCLVAMQGWKNIRPTKMILISGDLSTLQADQVSFSTSLLFVKGLFDHPSMIVCRKYEHICEGI